MLDILSFSLRGCELCKLFIFFRVGFFQQKIKPRLCAHDLTAEMRRKTTPIHSTSPGWNDMMIWRAFFIYFFFWDMRKHKDDGDLLWLSEFNFFQEKSLLFPSVYIFYVIWQHTRQYRLQFLYSRIKKFCLENNNYKKRDSNRNFFWSNRHNRAIKINRPFLHLCRSITRKWRNEDKNSQGKWHLFWLHKS